MESHRPCNTPWRYFVSHRQTPRQRRPPLDHPANQRDAGNPLGRYLSGNASWWLELNSELYADQHNPAEGELSTAGYGLVNLKTGVRFSQNVMLSLAVDNIFDRTYRNHLNMADFLYEPGINLRTSLKVTM